MSKKPRMKTTGKPVKPAARKITAASKVPGKRAASKVTAKKSSKPSRSGPTKAPPGVSSKSPTAAKSKQATATRFTLMEGAKAPAFELPRDGGKVVSLADFSGQKLVVFFYPRADTPGCTKEAIDFTRLKDAFAAAGTAIVGVSGDPLKAQEAFRNKHQLGVPLASDENHEMLAAYGAWGEKSMYGRTFMGVLRTTVLIGPDGKIIRIWRNVKVDGHADEVLAAAKAA